MSKPTDSAAAPAFSTPDERILEHASPAAVPILRQCSNDEFATIYEIDRTVAELARGGWQRIALQFPDEYLPDATRVVAALQDGLRREPRPGPPPGPVDGLETDMTHLNVSGDQRTSAEKPAEASTAPRLYILGDTSYGACCVDAVAAAHVDADLLVHYGRACLSPTDALPVIYVFTQQPLDHGPLLEAFRAEYQSRDQPVVLTADVPYARHVQALAKALTEDGYRNLFAAEVRHAPESPLPNRTVPPAVDTDPEALKSWRLFHVAEPPPALLLTVASRFEDIRVYPIAASQEASAAGTAPSQPRPSLPDPTAATARLLRRRYALVAALSRASTVGILVRSLSLTAFLPAVARLRQRLAAAGRAAYLFVVGKLNPAKLANFAEVDAWVAVGCWESALVLGDEDGGGGTQRFWKPVGTAWEMELALRGDAERVWTGAWEGGFASLIKEAEPDASGAGDAGAANEADLAHEERHVNQNGGPLDDEEESAPPEFDLRTGRYVAASPVAARPVEPTRANGHAGTASQALARRARGDIAVIGNGVSAGAEFLRTKRTWAGLGSDFEIAYDESRSSEPSTAIEEGRSGIARGYTNETQQQG